MFEKPVVELLWKFADPSSWLLDESFLIVAVNRTFVDLGTHVGVRVGTNLRTGEVAASATPPSRVPSTKRVATMAIPDRRDVRIDARVIGGFSLSSRTLKMAGIRPVQGVTVRQTGIGRQGGIRQRT